MSENHVTFDLPDADVAFDPLLFTQGDADRLFAALRDTTPWRQESIKLYGREIPLPRLTAWHGDGGAAFNGVLLNRYRTGQDGVAWHSDDEPEFGDDPVVASVSFGAARRFQLRHKARKELRAEVELTHGSLLVMRRATPLGPPGAEDQKAGRRADQPDVSARQNVSGEQIGPGTGGKRSWWKIRTY